MKECKVTIHGEKDIVLGAFAEDKNKEKEKTITDFDLSFETTDPGARDKDNAMLARIMVQGKVVDANRDDIKGLMEWAKKGGDSYRTVEVEIKFDQEVYGYKIPNVFIVSYKVDHASSDSRQGVTDAYTLCMTQAQNHLDEIKQF